LLKHLIYQANWQHFRYHLFLQINNWR